MIHGPPRRHLRAGERAAGSLRLQGPGAIAPQPDESDIATFLGRNWDFKVLSPVPDICVDSCLTSHMQCTCRHAEALYAGIVASVC